MTNRQLHNRNKDKNATDAEQGDRSDSNSVAESKPGSRSRHKDSRRRGRRKPKPKKEAWDVSQFDVPAVEGKLRFHDLNLPDVLMHAIYDLEFQYCSAIQAKILPHTLKGLDAIGKAQTGTGKTAAYLITVIEDLLRHPIEEERHHGDPRALIIAPTRELVMQIAEDAKALCKYTNLHTQFASGRDD